MSHPIRQLDNTVHQRTRLGILAVLCESGRADFTYLRQTLELTDGNLSRNLTRLQEAGYVTADKQSQRGRTRTWLSVTAAGRRALDEELAALRDIIARVDAPAPSRRRPAPRPDTALG